MKIVGKIVVAFLVMAGIWLQFVALSATQGGFHGTGTTLSGVQVGIGVAWFGTGLLFTLYCMTNGLRLKLAFAADFIIGILAAIWALAAQPFSRLGADPMDLFVIGYVANIALFVLAGWFIRRHHFEKI